MKEPYEPEVNDYVIWDKGEYGIDEGGVYFKCPPMDDLKGFPSKPRYITIETDVKPKPKDQYSSQDRHKMIHTLLLCYESDWKNLEYIKSRPSLYPCHYSECEN